MKNAIKALWMLLLLPLALSAAPRVADPAEFSPAELDQMLAPIALYPDTVLSHVLIAATYPLEVVQAARWTRSHSGLQGQAAVTAAQDQPWDPSVIALVAFPELLERLDADLEWTQDLGEAFLLQEADVSATVQNLRQHAYASGHLQSAEHLKVVREREVITIEPVVSRIVYLPYYDTRVVYGSWWWADYPPVYWHHGHHRTAYAGPWFRWSVGFHLAPSFYFTAFLWPQHHVVVLNHHHHDRHVYSARQVSRHRSAQRWSHDSAHRRGVQYRRPALAETYRGHSARRQEVRHGAQTRAKSESNSRRGQAVTASSGQSQDGQSRRQRSDTGREHSVARRPESKTSRPKDAATKTEDSRDNAGERSRRQERVAKDTDATARQREAEPRESRKVHQQERSERADRTSRQNDDRASQRSTDRGQREQRSRPERSSPQRAKR